MKNHAYGKKVSTVESAVWGTTTKATAERVLRVVGVSPSRLSDWASLQDVESVLSGVNVGRVGKTVPGFEAAKPYRDVAELISERSTRKRKSRRQQTRRAKIDVNCSSHKR